MQNLTLVFFNKGFSSDPCSIDGISSYGSNDIPFITTTVSNRVAISKPLKDNIAHKYKETKHKF